MGHCSPSKLPMLAECPCFQSTEAGLAAERGSIQHAVIEEHFLGNEPSWKSLWPSEKKKVRWAIRWIEKNTSSQRQVEVEVRPSRSDIAVVGRGFIDVLDTSDGIHIVDYKSGGEAHYLPQLAVYGLIMMRKMGTSEARLTLLYGKTEEIVSEVLSNAEAEEIVLPIVAAVKNPEKKPCLCKYCSWCLRVRTCSALPASVRRAFAESTERKKPE